MAEATEGPVLGSRGSGIGLEDRLAEEASQAEPHRLWWPQAKAGLSPGWAS